MVAVELRNGCKPGMFTALVQETCVVYIPPGQATRRLPCHSFALLSVAVDSRLLKFSCLFKFSGNSVCSFQSIFGTMASSTPKAQFSINWTVPTTSWPSIGKRFITSYNNVSLRWNASFSLVSFPDRVRGDCLATRFCLYFEDGPVEKFDAMNYKIAIVKSDQSICGELTRHENYEAKRSSIDGSTMFSGPPLRQQYGLNESAPLIFRVILQIPISVFSFKMENPLPTAPPPQWMVDLFNRIEDQQRSTYSDAKIISADGSVFYCHKIVISSQSAAIGAMFRHPPAEDQPDGQYPFPNLSTDSLKAFLQFLYTSQASMENLLMTEVFELADAAEQYNLKPLKQACGSLMWDNAVKDRWSCFEIIRFSDLIDDLKYLKNRAMDVLAENFEEMELFEENVASRFGDGENGKRLRGEFQLFVSRRVEPN